MTDKPWQKIQRANTSPYNTGHKSKGRVSQILKKIEINSGALELLTVCTARYTGDTSYSVTPSQKKK